MNTSACSFDCTHFIYRATVLRMKYDATANERVRERETVCHGEQDEWITYLHNKMQHRKCETRKETANSTYTHTKQPNKIKRRKRWQNVQYTALCGTSKANGLIQCWLHVYLYARIWQRSEIKGGRELVERANNEAACLFEWACSSPYFGHFAKTRYYYYYIVLASIEIDVEYFHLSRPNSGCFVESVRCLHTLPLLYYHFCLVHTATSRTRVIRSLADDFCSNDNDDGGGDRGHLIPKLTRTESNIRRTDIY